MEKKVAILFLISLMMIVLNAVMLIQYNGRATGNEAVISLNVGGNPCGDTRCSTEETCSSCPTDCGSCPVTPPPGGPGSGGGGGGGAGEKEKPKYYSLKMIFPDNVFMYSNETIEVPIRIENPADIDFKGINLSSMLFFNNWRSNDLEMSLATTYLEKLNAGSSYNLIMRIRAKTTDIGLYKVTLKADVSDPEIHDSGDFFIDVRSLGNGSGYLGNILSFSDRLLFNNPKCIELKEMIFEAENLYNKGDINASVDLTKKAVDACKNAISYEQASIKRGFENFLLYALIITFLILIIWLIIYIRQKKKYLRLASKVKRRQKRKMKLGQEMIKTDDEVEKQEEEKEETPLQEIGNQQSQPRSAQPQPGNNNTA
jgi:hypothetical protein